MSGSTDPRSCIELDRPLCWGQVAAVANGAGLRLSGTARARIKTARAIVDELTERGLPAYGVNTGVGALCQVAVDRSQQRELSHNIVMSHACGVGPALEAEAVRAVMTAQINNFAHGHSGVRPEVARLLCRMLDRHCTPEVPSRGSVGYLTYTAHIALVLLGAGAVTMDGDRLTGREALARLGCAPLVLEAKEGLSLVNGTACGTGLACIALDRARKLLCWADAVAAMSIENLGGQLQGFAEHGLALQASPGIRAVGAHLRGLLADSPMIAGHAGSRLQDALSLRAVPQVHGAARDVFLQTALAVDRELASPNDNPLLLGTRARPELFSGAQAVGAALGLAMESLGTALATVAAMSERRTDRLLNPTTSNLPAFLATSRGVRSGFMIAQYTAVSLVAENRRLAAAASLGGGVTSALQEDHLAHATTAAYATLAIIANVESILAIELLVATQAYELQTPGGAGPGVRTDALRRRVRSVVPPYHDDRPLAHDIDRVSRFLRGVLLELQPGEDYAVPSAVGSCRDETSAEDGTVT